MADYKQLMKLVERVAMKIERAPENETTVKIVADAIIGQLRDELGIYGGRLYRRQGNGYGLMATVGEAKRVAAEVSVPLDYKPVQIVLAKRVLYMDAADPRTDPQLEAALGAGKFAAIEVDNGNHILAFDIGAGHGRDDVMVALGILRHSINHKLRQERLEGIFEESRRIQTSILPRRPPRFEGFDIHGRSDSLDLVGGDYFDFIPISEKSIEAEWKGSLRRKLFEAQEAFERARFGTSAEPAPPILDPEPEEDFASQLAAIFGE